MSRRWLARTVFAIAALALLLVGGMTGVRPLPFVPGRVPEAAVAMATFGTFVLVSGTLYARRLRTDGRSDPSPIDGPVTAIVPTYRDDEVLHRSVESLLACDHPVGIKIVPEPDDEAGIEAARRFADHECVECLVNRRPGSKAGAINDAVRRSDGDAFAVFDADQEVPRDFFERIAAAFGNADVVQARFLPRPSGPVESLAYYEHVLFNYCFRQPLYATSSFRMATSKAVVFDRETFEAVGGYDPAMVTEDTDFGHRCFLAGMTVRLAYHPAVREESVHSLWDWWGQRKRWMAGNVQVLGRLLADLGGDPLRRRRYVSLGVGLGSVGGAAFLLTLVPKFAWLLAEGAYGVAALPLLAVYAVTAYARTVDDESLDGHWVLVPLALPLFSLVTLMAVAEVVAGVRTTWFAVEKGETG